MLKLIQYFHHPNQIKGIRTYEWIWTGYSDRILFNIQCMKITLLSPAESFLFITKSGSGSNYDQNDGEGYIHLHLVNHYGIFLNRSLLVWSCCTTYWGSVPWLELQWSPFSPRCSTLWPHSFPEHRKAHWWASNSSKFLPQEYGLELTWR